MIPIQTIPMTTIELHAENVRLRLELELAVEAADYALWFATFHQSATLRLQDALVELEAADAAPLLRRRIAELLEKRPV